MAADTNAAVQPNSADLQLIDQFLTGRLANKERAMVETRIVADPDFRCEVEFIEAMRQGMRELERKGAIEILLSPQTSFWHRRPTAVAASVVAGLFAATSILLYTRLHLKQEEVRVATTIAPTVARETLRFETKRSAAGTPDLTWRRPAVPTLLDLQFDIGLEPATRYSMTFEQMKLDADPIVLLTAFVGIDGDGLAEITLHSTLLKRGQYRVRLEPAPSPDFDADHSTVIYSFHVND